MSLEVSVSEVKRRLDAGDKLQMIDVREPHEHDVASIAGADLIPMNTIPQRLSELDGRSDEAVLIVFCHAGVRSLMVVNWLRNQGVDACLSMTGGIDQWSREIDPSVPRY